MNNTVSLTPQCQEFIQTPLLAHFYGGEWQPSVQGASYQVINPSDGFPLATVADGQAEDLNRAVDAASKAFPVWAEMPARERSILLHRLADAIERDAETLAEIESLDVGKAIGATRSFDLPFGVEGIRYFADLAVSTQAHIPLAIKHMEASVHLTPYGVCGFIFPWNFPFDLLMWGTMPALAAGNTVVVKPSEVTPLSTLYVAKLAAEVGFPPGVFNVVVGTGATVGETLVKHPAVRRISFTGSPVVGKAIGRACGERLIPCKLELGGKGAAIIFDDVDIENTAQQLAAAITFNTGQVCCTATRWVVQDKIRDELVSRVIAHLDAVKIGPAFSDSTTMGPVVSEVHRNRILTYLERGEAEGAETLLRGGTTTLPASGNGFYLKPTLLGGSEENVCYREEIFGPVAFVTSFQEEAAAIQSVNSLSYGLANSVWSADLSRANRVARRLVAGNSWINAHNVFAYGLPYGGYNESGLGGGVNSAETYFDYLRHQTIARPLPMTK